MAGLSCSNHQTLPQAPSRVRLESRHPGSRPHVPLTSRGPKGFTACEWLKRSCAQRACKVVCIGEAMYVQACVRVSTRQQVYAKPSVCKSARVPGHVYVQTCACERQHACGKPHVCKAMCMCQAIWMYVQACVCARLLAHQAMCVYKAGCMLKAVCVCKVACMCTTLCICVGPCMCESNVCARPCTCAKPCMQRSMSWQGCTQAKGTVHVCRAMSVQRLVRMQSHMHMRRTYTKPGVQV